MFSGSVGKTGNNQKTFVVLFAAVWPAITASLREENKFLTPQSTVVQDLDTVLHLGQGLPVFDT